MKYTILIFTLFLTITVGKSANATETRTMLDCSSCSNFKMKLKAQRARTEGFVDVVDFKAGKIKSFSVVKYIEQGQEIFSASPVLTERYLVQEFLKRKELLDELEKLDDIEVPANIALSAWSVVHSTSGLGNIISWANENTWSYQVWSGFSGFAQLWPGYNGPTLTFTFPDGSILIIEATHADLGGVSVVRIVLAQDERNQNIALDLINSTNLTYGFSSAGTTLIEFIQAAQRAGITITGPYGGGFETSCKVQDNVIICQIIRR